jgi:hypothetical protein
MTVNGSSCHTSRQKHTKEDTTTMRIATTVSVSGQCVMQFANSKMNVIICYDKTIVIYGPI